MQVRFMGAFSAIFLIASCAGYEDDEYAFDRACHYSSLQEILADLPNAEGRTFCGDTYFRPFASSTFVADQPVVSLSDEIVFVPVVQGSAFFIYEFDQPTPVRMVATIDILERCFPDDYVIDFTRLSCVPYNYPVELIVQQLEVNGIAE